MEIRSLVFKATIIFSLFLPASNALAARKCELVSWGQTDGGLYPNYSCSGTSEAHALAGRLGGSSSIGGDGGSGNSRPKESSSLYNPKPPTSVQSATPLPSSKPSQSISLLQALTQKKLENPLLSKTTQTMGDNAKAVAQSLVEMNRLSAERLSSINQNMANQAQKTMNYLATVIMITKIIDHGIQHRVDFEKNLGEQDEKKFAVVKHELLSAVEAEANSIDDVERPHFVNQPQYEGKEKEIRNWVATNLRGSKQSNAEKSLAVVDTALGVMSSEDSKSESKEAAAAALGFAIASAEAASDGDQVNAAIFSEKSLVLLDISFGFVPIGGSVNDLAQIAFGLATGQDYTGQQMRGSDYLFRSFGVVLGLVPVAKIGQIVISQSFMRGAQMLRNYPILSHQISAVSRLGDRVGIFTSFVGTVLSHGVYTYEFLKENGRLLPRIADHALDVAKRLSPSESEALLSFIRGASLNARDRWQIIHSFQVGSLEIVTLKQGDLLYRWAADANAGRFFSPVIYNSPEVARSLLALPSSNTLARLAEFEVLHGTQALKGVIGSNFGHPGGGTQLFLQHGSVRLKKVLK